MKIKNGLKDDVPFQNFQANQAAHKIDHSRSCTGNIISSGAGVEQAKRLSAWEKQVVEKKKAMASIMSDKVFQKHTEALAELSLQ